MGKMELFWWGKLGLLLFLVVLSSVGRGEHRERVSQIVYEAIHVKGRAILNTTVLGLMENLLNERVRYQMLKGCDSHLAFKKKVYERLYDRALIEKTLDEIVNAVSPIQIRRRARDRLVEDVFVIEKRKRFQKRRQELKQYLSLLKRYRTDLELKKQIVSLSQVLITANKMERFVLGQIGDRLRAVVRVQKSVQALMDRGEPGVAESIKATLFPFVDGQWDTALSMWETNVRNEIKEAIRQQFVKRTKLALATQHLRTSDVSPSPGSLSGMSLERVVASLLEKRLGEGQQQTRQMLDVYVSPQEMRRFYRRNRDQPRFKSMFFPSGSHQEAVVQNMAFTVLPLDEYRKDDQRRQRWFVLLMNIAHKRLKKSIQDAVDGSKNSSRTIKTTLTELVQRIKKRGSWIVQTLDDDRLSVAEKIETLGSQILLEEADLEAFLISNLSFWIKWLSQESRKAGHGFDAQDTKYIRVVQGIWEGVRNRQTAVLESLGHNVTHMAHVVSHTFVRELQEQWVGSPVDSETFRRNRSMRFLSRFFLQKMLRLTGILILHSERIDCFLDVFFEHVLNRDFNANEKYDHDVLKGVVGLSQRMEVFQKQFPLETYRFRSRKKAHEVPFKLDTRKAVQKAYLRHLGLHSMELGVVEAIDRYDPLPFDDTRVQDKIRRYLVEGKMRRAWRNLIAAKVTDYRVEMVKPVRFLDTMSLGQRVMVLGKWRRKKRQVGQSVRAVMIQDPHDRFVGYRFRWDTQPYDVFSMLQNEAIPDPLHGCDWPGSE